MAISHKLIVVAALAVMLIATAEATGCSSGYQLCNGKCVNLKTDFNNCGRCGNRCYTNIKGKCIDGYCQYCPPGTTYCSTNGGYGRCSNLHNSNQDCGWCNHACSGNTKCYHGKCK
jgi:hypothetical protein